MEQVLSACGRRLSITQSDSYHSLSVKQLTAQQQMVVDCFQPEDAALTREDIASRTNLRLSSVCGRVRELLDARRLVVKGARRCVATGKKHELLAMASR